MKKAPYVRKTSLGIQRQPKKKLEEISEESFCFSDNENLDKSSTPFHVNGSNRRTESMRKVPRSEDGKSEVQKSVKITVEELDDGEDGEIDYTEDLNSLTF